MAWVKNHLGFALLLVVVPLGVAVSRGNILVALCVGILAAVVAIAAVHLVNRGSASAAESALPSTLTWTVPLPVGTPNDVTQARLAAIGLVAEGDGSLRSGSQLRTRLLGGYFVAPRHLPIKVSWSQTRQEPNEIYVEDGLGPIAIRDRALAKRYEMRVAQIRDAVTGHRTAESASGGDV